jgi:hypothetical protein
MSEPQAFTSYGALQVKKSYSYTSSNLPTDVTIDVLRIAEAPIIWRKYLNQDGSQVIEKGLPKYIRGNKRGVYVLIVNANATYSEENPNVPILYLEGSEIVADTDNTYTFLEDCIVEYGKKVA